VWTLWAQAEHWADQLAQPDPGVSPWWIVLGSLVTAVVTALTSSAVTLMRARQQLNLARRETDAKIAVAQAAAQLKVDAQAARQRRADLEAALVEWKAIATDLRERDDNQQEQINELASAKAKCEQKSAVLEAEVRHLQAALGLPSQPRPGDGSPPAKEGTQP
jgi:chromosome segregation ATPase